MSIALTVLRRAATGALFTGLLLVPSLSFAAGTPSPAPAPCDVNPGTTFLTATRQINNEPDSGVHGYWATDTFSQNITVWVAADGTYCATANTTDGAFVTTGPLSPEHGDTLASGITGTFTGGETFTIPAGTVLADGLSTTTLTSNFPLDPSDGTERYPSWIHQVFPSIAVADTGSLVNTYSFTYVTPNNGTWTDADSGDQGDISFPTTVYVSPTGNDSNDGSQAVPFATIGKAISSVATGGTVNLAPGIYQEKVSITKNVTITGAGQGSTFIQAPASLPTQGMIVDVSGAGVSATISGVTVEGPGPSNCGSLMAGIFVENGANASIHDAAVTDVRDSTFSGCQNGRAILVGWGHGSTISNTTGTATITGVTITGYQKAGIEVSGAGSSATITGNTITGMGATPTIAANGIELTYGAGGTITGNTIANNSYTGGALACAGDGSTGNHADFYNNCDAATGILLYQQATGVVVSGNTLTNNQIGIDVSGPNGATISDKNSVTGSALYALHTDVATVDASKNYWGVAGDPATAGVVAGTSLTSAPWYADSGMTNLVTGVASTDTQTTSTDAGTITTTIAAGTTITSTNSSWDGIVHAPMAVSTTTMTLTSGGETLTPVVAIEVGSGSSSLTLSSPAELVFAGQAGKSVGWSLSGGAFHLISAICSSDTAAGIPLGSNDCAITVGNDLHVWTNHFTTFVVVDPVIDTVSIASNNTNTAWAKAGDVITVSFTSAADIDVADPAVLGTIAGHAAVFTKTGTGAWTAKAATVLNDTEGTVAFSLNIDGTIVTGTTDSSEVTYDQTPPVVVVNAFAPIGGPGQSSVAFSGTCESGLPLTITAANGLLSSSLSSISCTGSTWNASLNLSTLGDGTVTATAVQTDLAGNTGNGSSAATKYTVHPHVTILGSTPMNLSVGGTFSDPGVGGYSSGTATPLVFTATSSSNGVDVAGAVVDTSVAGSTFITYRGTDIFGNYTEDYRMVIVSKIAQAITFSALTDATYGDADFTVGATASSGLTVTFGATGDCTVSGTTVHITGAGSCTITASQAGNGTYSAATDVPQTLTIHKQAVTVTLSDLSPTWDGSSKAATVDTNPVGISTSVTYNGSATVPSNTGSYAVVATVTDPNYVGTATDTLVITDRVNPVVAVSGSSVYYTGVGQAYTDAGATATDDHDGTDAVTSDIATSLNTAVAGDYTITYTATDAGGNSATATRLVHVIVPPTVTSFTAVGATTTNASTVSYQVVFNEAVLGVTAGNFTIGSTGTLSGVHVQSVSTGDFHTYTVVVATGAGDGHIALALDQNLSSITDQSHATVQMVSTAVGTESFIIDRTAPSIAAHADITAEATSASGAVVSFTNPAATDVVDGTDAVSCTPVSGSTFALGTTTVSCSSTDTAGNSSSTSWSVVVRDTTAPAISAHADVIAEATAATGAVVSFALPTATDAVDGMDTVSCNATSGSIFALGTTTVSCTSTDAAHNVSTSSFKIVVRDTTAPTVTLVGSAAIELAFGDVFTDQGVTITDAVDGNSTATSSTVVDTHDPRVYVLSYTITDAAGNTAATVVRTVTVDQYVPNNIGGGGGGGSASHLATPDSSGSVDSGGAVLGAATYNFTTDLTVGSRGADVTALQQILIDAGFMTGEPTGYFGAITRGAVVKYQQAHGIRATGYVGPLTRAQLNLGSTPTMTDEQRSLIMQQIQALMAQIRVLQGQ